MTETRNETMTASHSILRGLILLGILLCPHLVLQAQTFCSEAIPDSIWTRMLGRSYPDTPTPRAVPREQLRLLRLSHYDFQGNEQEGLMICHKDIAGDLLYIFRKLHEAHYPITSLRLMDDFDGNDELSMSHNNTSCFCHRMVAGSTILSKHSQGKAVDINPLINPCVYPESGKVLPPQGRPYAFRRDTLRHLPGKIDTTDLCYRLFASRGFKWGGHWHSLHDYQHFEK